MSFVFQRIDNTGSKLSGKSMNQVHKSPVFDSPPGPLSEIFKEGVSCHIRVYLHKSPLFRNAREGSPRMRRG